MASILPARYGASADPGAVHPDGIDGGRGSSSVSGASAVPGVQTRQTPQERETDDQQRQGGGPLTKKRGRNGEGDDSAGVPPRDCEPRTQPGYSDDQAYKNCGTDASQRNAPHVSLVPVGL